MLEGSRHEARERAVTLLYETEMKESSVSDVLAALPLEPDAYTAELLKQVESSREVIDKHITDAAKDWSLDRMPAIDLAILRVATAELLTQDDVPTPVVIDEAVELAKEFSTDDSGRFINGVLSAIEKSVR